MRKVRASDKKTALRTSLASLLSCISLLAGIIFAYLSESILILGFLIESLGFPSSLLARLISPSLTEVWLLLLRVVYYAGERSRFVAASDCCRRTSPTTSSASGPKASSGGGKGVGLGAGGAGTGAGTGQGGNGQGGNGQGGTGVEQPQRSRNARAQARHRAKRKAYIEQVSCFGFWICFFFCRCGEM